MEPFTSEDARSALRASVGDFDRRERRKQIEIHDVRAWYNSDSIINGEKIVAGLLASEEQARADGYNGFRTQGNIGWLGGNQWDDFQDYEARVTRSLGVDRMISMCSYCLDSCGPKEFMDVTTLAQSRSYTAAQRLVVRRYYAPRAEQPECRHDRRASGLSSGAAWSTRKR